MSANGVSTGGFQSNLTNGVPTMMDLYCKMYQQYTVLSVDIQFMPIVYTSYQNISSTAVYSTSNHPVVSSIQQDGQLVTDLSSNFHNNTGMMTPYGHLHSRSLQTQKLLQLNQSQPLIPTNSSSASRSLWASPAIINMIGFPQVPGNFAAGYLIYRILCRFEELL